MDVGRKVLGGGTYMLATREVMAAHCQAHQKFLDGVLLARQQSTQFTTHSKTQFVSDYYE